MFISGNRQVLNRSSEGFLLIMTTMIYPSDYLLHFHPQSDKNLYAQESGDAGLSSNMRHKFCCVYEESDLPVVDTGSFVRPIPKEELDSFQTPIIAKNTPHPFEFGTESQSAYEAEGFFNLCSLTIVQNNCFPPQPVVKGRTSCFKQEETDEDLCETTTSSEQGMEEAGGNGSIIETNMDAKKNPTKGAPVENMAKDHSYRKRAAGKKWKVCHQCVVAVLLICVLCKESAGTDAAVAPNCYVCMDMEKCSNLRMIYDQNDLLLYKRNGTGPFPECSEIPPHVPDSSKACSVCQGQSSVLISCSEDAGEIQPEGDDSHIENISKTCEQEKTPDPPHDKPDRVHPGLISAVALIISLIILAALILFLGWKKRTRSNQQTPE